jgi:hypothetical protein
MTCAPVGIATHLGPTSDPNWGENRTASHHVFVLCSCGRVFNGVHHDPDEAAMAVTRDVAKHLMDTLALEASG